MRWQDTSFSKAGNTFSFPATKLSAAGAIPPELGHLRELRVLWLNVNQLTGAFFFLVVSLLVFILMSLADGMNAKKRLKSRQHNQVTRELVVVEPQFLQLLEIYQLRWDGACSESANKNQQEVKQEIPNLSLIHI